MEDNYMLQVKDKKVGNFSNYVTEGYGLYIDSFTYEDAGYVREWKLSNTVREWTGKTIPELLDTLKSLKSQYDLKTTFKKGNKRDTEYRDLLVIYTDDLFKAKCFLYNYGLTDEFKFYIQILDNIEIRECWYDDVDSAKDLAEWAQFMIDELFIPAKFFYITPNQVFRKTIQKVRKSVKCTIAEQIYPKTHFDYLQLKKGYFGGILYSPFDFIIYDNMLGLDIKSAYIYCMLIEQHCMSEQKEVNADNWEYYLSSKTKASFGEYTIKYSAYKKETMAIISCYKNVDTHKCMTGEHVEDTFMLTNIDLKLFLDNVDVDYVKCNYLYEYDLDYLPAYVRDELVLDFCLKEEYSKKYGKKHPKTRVQKIKLNGGYGETVRKWSRTEYDEDRKDPNMAPQWGVWTTSYCKRLLIELATQLDGWYYSATDSIYCLDTPENRDALFNYNSRIRNNVKVFCDKFGYDYNALQDLGSFVIEKEIEQFRAFGPNQYMYTTTDGNTMIKASGCNKEYLRNLTEEQKRKLYFADHIPVGCVYRYYFNPEVTNCEIDGTIYTSNGSYYAVRYEGIVAEFVVLSELAIKQIDN